MTSREQLIVDYLEARAACHAAEVEAAAVIEAYQAVAKALSSLEQWASSAFAAGLRRGLADLRISGEAVIAHALELRRVERAAEGAALAGGVTAWDLP